MGTWPKWGTWDFHVCGGAGLVPGSLVDGFQNGHFAANTAGDWARCYVSAGQWKFDVIAHWGGAVVPNQLISPADADGGRALAIDADGEMIGTWKQSTGQISHSRIPA